MREWEEWSENWLDGLDFKEYCDEVHLAIQSIGIATIASIQRRVVRRNDQGYLADALARLIATGSIRERNTVARATYEVKEVPVPPKPKQWSGFNSQKAPKPMPVPDGLQVFGDKSLY